ncbi:MAG: radical SAM protein [Elusimicrobia bacterium]|nr:radical SAM protein [Elusimicrobiota bacterium]
MKYFNKVFLVSPDEKKFLWNAGDRVPLGLLYISKALSENGVENQVFDLNHYETSKFLEKVEDETPAWVGFSIISSPSFNQIKKIAEKVKKISPKIKIVAGGSHLSALPHSLDGIADAIVVGAGENGIVKVIKEGKTGIINEPFEINDYPVPNRGKLDYKDYKMYADGLLTATIITSRGCPFNCFFCASHERKVQFRNSENVRKEVKILKKQGYESIYILDENFVIKEKHFEKIIKIMKQEDMKYRMEMRADRVSEEIAEKLKQTGCRYVALGIESGDNEILKKINKGTTVEINRRAIEILGKRGIYVKGFFIIGLPGETEQSAGKTIEFAENMREKGLSSADFYALTPFPGSAIWDNPEKYGIKILDRNYDNYLQKGDPVIETEYLSNKKIKKLVDGARARWKK